MRLDRRRVILRSGRVPDKEKAYARHHQRSLPQRRQTILFRPPGRDLPGGRRGHCGDRRRERVRRVRPGQLHPAGGGADRPPAPPAPPGHPGGPGRGGAKPGKREVCVQGLPGKNSGPQAGDEAGQRGVQLRGHPHHLLLHVRRPGGLPPGLWPDAAGSPPRYLTFGSSAR